MPDGVLRLLLASPTPSPPGSEGGLDPNSVSPGVIGFLATFALVLVSLLLFLNMSSRLRRMRYREEHRQQPPDDETPPKR